MEPDRAFETKPTVVDYAVRRQAGLALHLAIMGREHPDPTTPREAALIDFVFAEIWSRGVLTRRERRLITLACAAGSDAHQTLADHVDAALVTGDLDEDELGELVLHFAVYCGWGKAESVERIVRDRIAVAQHAGIRPARAPRPEPLTAIPADQELRKQGGEREFREVNIVPSPPRGVPYYDDGILNFVFGDMWQRPGLGRRDRRWITLACVALDDTIVPIRSHVYSAMKSGDITFHEMRELVLQFAAYCGWPKASFLQQVVDESHDRIVEEDAAASTG
ncbi:MAG: hypothetical protein RLZZ623_3931 [Actinomycetota bacterium]